MPRRSSIVRRPSSIVNRPSPVLVVAGICLLLCSPAVQAQERIRLSVGGGQQTTTLAFEDNQTLQQYLESGSFKFERTIPRRSFFDAGGAVRIWKSLHAGMAVSFLNDTGTGKVTEQVPHPLFFNQLRTVTGDVQNISRKETGVHFQVSWTMPTTRGVEISVFAGPSIFITEQTYVTKLTLGLDKETYPYDSLAFAGVTTGTFKGTISGYNAGADVTWRFARHIGAGILIRYANGKKNFTPTDGKPFNVEVGGLHAGGGLRLIL